MWEVNQLIYVYEYNAYINLHTYLYIKIIFEGWKDLFWVMVSVVLVHHMEKVWVVD
jgi:hypothetical protein